MIWRCERLTMGSLATVRDRPVASRGEQYAGRRRPLPHALVMPSQKVVRVWQFSDSLVALRKRARPCLRGPDGANAIVRPALGARRSA